MYLSLAYKEWLKIRWWAVGSLILELLMLIYIFTNLRAVIEYNSAEIFWNSIIYKSYLFFESLRYIPFFIGILISGAQYLPEVLDMKLKLTLHLPLLENRILLFLNIFGATILAALFTILIVILLICLNILFPREINYAIFLTIIPWSLAGFLSYFFVASILIEPVWSRRVVIAVVGFIIINEFLVNVILGSFINVINILLIITLLYNYVHMLSGLRFKRGAK